MAIQYSSGQIYTNFTCSTGTRREIVNGLAAALLSAGWSYISGSGTGDVKMLTATTPQGMKTAVRIYDPGSGNCAKVFLYNSNSTYYQTGGCYLLPAVSKVFQVIANPYQFFIFVTGSTTARDFVAGGTPWIPSWNSSITECGWLISNSQSDSDTTIRPSFRTQPMTVASGALYCNQAFYVNSSLTENNNTNWGINWSPGDIQLLCLHPAQEQNNNNSTNNMMRWYDGSGMIYEPIIGWGVNGSTGYNTDATAIGQLWDCALMTVPFASETTTTFDSHNWINLASNITGANSYYPRYSMWLVTP